MATIDPHKLDDDDPRKPYLIQIEADLDSGAGDAAVLTKRQAMIEKLTKSNPEDVRAAYMGDVHANLGQIPQAQDDDEPAEAI